MRPGAGPPTPRLARTIGAVLLVPACALLALAAASPGAGAGAAAPTRPTWVAADGRVTHPPARQDAAAAYDPIRNKVVLFGGASPGRLDDTWTWDGRAWERQSPNGAHPEARSGAAMAFDGRRLVLFGGRTASGVLGDTWLWDGTWRAAPRQSGAVPPKRAGAAMAFDGHRVVLFGGAGASGLRSDTWTWDPDASRWEAWTAPTTTSKAPAPGSPSARTEAAMAFDDKHGSLVLFGGSAAGGTMQDTWTWKGTWTQVPSAAADPDARRAAAMAFDQATQRVVLFGGERRTTDRGAPVTTRLDDTWTWDGTWHHEDPLQHPSARRGPVLVPGPAPQGTNRPLMLFGGTGAAALGDTWTWQGSSALTTSTTSPTSSTTSTVPASGPSGRLAVQGVVPGSGPTSGGTSVSITGAGFVGVTAVSFGDAEVGCPEQDVCDVSDDGHIRVTAPPHDSGTVHVVVTTATGTSPATDADVFVYEAAAAGAVDASFATEGGGFGNTEPLQTAPPGGGGFQPLPGAGFPSTPGLNAGTNGPGPPGGVVAPPPATPVVAGGVAPFGPGAAPGFVAPGAPPPPAPAAGPFPDASRLPGVAPHHNMVGWTGSGGDDGPAAAAALAGAGALFVLFCFRHARRSPAAGLAAAPQAGRAY